MRASDACSLFALVLACLVLPGGPSMAGAAEGMAAWRTGDYAAALREWEPLAATGDRIAQFNLGLIYENGRGVAPDKARAALWYRRSADQGYAPAQNNLGRMYFMGDGVAEDYAKAVALLHEAAEQGVAFSHFFLGMIFTTGGGGVQADPVEAYRRLTLAAALHDSPRHRAEALASRRLVAAKMSTDQIAVAEQLAHRWMTEFRRRTGK